MQYSILFVIVQNQIFKNFLVNMLKETPQNLVSISIMIVIVF